MKVKLNATGEVAEFDSGYALRLYCDGQAEILPEEHAETEPEEKAEKAEEPEKEETADAKARSRKKKAE